MRSVPAIRSNSTFPSTRKGHVSRRQLWRRKLNIIFEDDNLLVIDKPAGLAVHEGKTVSKRDSILGHFGTAISRRSVKPQLVHRLDQDTSGLLIIAKNQKTDEELALAFETGAVDKEYLALVAGRLANDQARSTLRCRDAKETRCAR